MFHAFFLCSKHDGEHSNAGFRQQDFGTLEIHLGTACVVQATHDAPSNHLSPPVLCNSSVRPSNKQHLLRWLWALLRHTCRPLVVYNACTRAYSCGYDWIRGSGASDGFMRRKLASFCDVMVDFTQQPATHHHHCPVNSTQVGQTGTSATWYQKKF